MANNHDVRVWARDNGYPDLSDSGPLPAEVKEKYSAYEAELIPSDGPAEVRPQVKKPTIADRMRETVQRPQRKPAQRVRKAAAKPARPRSSISGILSFAWDTLASVVEVVSPPTAYIMEFQAPVAGEILEESVKNTLVDRVLQPIARVEGQAKTAGALIGPPLMVAMLQARPDLHKHIIPRLRNSLMSWMDVAGPKVQALKERNEQFEKLYGTDVDKIIDGLMAFFQAPPTDPNTTL
jgi:hypothetical protein